MKTVASPADAAPTDRQVASADAATPSDVPIVTPTKTNATLEEYAVAASPRSKTRGGPSSSCKRRRLDSEDDENVGEAPTTPNSLGGSARKLNYERRNGNDSETSEDSDNEGDIDREIAQEHQERVLRKIRRLNYEDEEDKLLHTAAYAKLFEYVKDYDVVARTSSFNSNNAARAACHNGDSKGAWKYRGSGCVKFVKCMEEGYNCGMIRAELTKNGTLELLMCHELTHEEVQPMQSKKGKAYTWRCKDWAYHQVTRTFAIRFDDDMDALEWKAELERSKANNINVRKGINVPDVSAEVNDVCSSFRNLTTASA